MLDPTRRDFTDEQKDEQQEPEQRLSHRSGGPTSLAGKNSSSKNSVRHGCRSNVVILHDENPEDLDALYDRWQEAYQPDSEAALELLEQFVLNKWYLLRNERRFNQVEFQLSEFEYTKWNEGQHRIFQLTMRYKTAAERAASKSQRDLEDYFKNRRADEKHRQSLIHRERATQRQGEKDFERREQNLEKQLQVAEAKGLDVAAQKSDLADFRKRNRESFARFRAQLDALANTQPPVFLFFDGQHSPKKLRGDNILEQSVAVTVEDTLTVTRLTPSNQQLLARAQTMQPPPAFIYRRLDFPHGIPDEYAWTTDEPLLRRSSATGTQRIPIDTWILLTSAEILRPGGHIGPLPQPLSVSDCRACQLIHQRLQALPEP